MSSSGYRDLLSRAARTHGVFSWRDAQELGVAQSTLCRAKKDGRLLNPAPGTYVVAGSPDTPLQRLAVGVQSMPALSAASHDTAAELWGLTRRGMRANHLVTTRWDRVRRPGIVVHESLDLIAEDVVVRGGIPVTSAARTVVDLGASNKWVVERALEEGIRRGLLISRDVQRVVDRVGRRGRRGVGVIRPLLEARREWDTVTESALEDLFRETLEELDMPQPIPQYVVRDPSGTLVCRADFAYPDLRLLIELDSEAHHLDRITFRRDRSKQNEAMTLGWKILRFTWWDLRDDPYRVRAQIRAIADTRQPS